MKCYAKHPDGIERWLALNARLISIGVTPESYIRQDQGWLLVCLINEGPHRYAQIMHSKAAFDEVIDSKNLAGKVWYAAPIDKLAEVSDIRTMLMQDTAP